MKRIICFAVALATAVTLAETRKTIELELGGSGSVELTFIPKSYRFLDKELVTVSLTESRTVNVSAGKTPGRCQIQFNNAAGGDGAILTVNILNEMDFLARQLEDEWLSDFAGSVVCTPGLKGVTLRGTVSSPAKFKQLQKICSLPDFKDKVDCSMVKLSLDGKALNKLRKDFEDAGIKLAAPGAKPEIGEMSVSYGEEDGLILNGTFYSGADRQKVLSILKRQTWVGEMAATNGLVGPSISVNSAIPIHGTLEVDDTMMELGVAFLKISKSRTKQVGTFDADGKPIEGLSVRGIWSGFYDFVNGRHSHNGADQFNISAGLDSTIAMLGGNGITRARQQGTIRIHANGDPGKEFHLGGKMTVTPPAAPEGESPRAQDYPYGFKVINKMTRRTSETDAEADVDIVLDGLPEFKYNSGVKGALVIDQQQKKVSPTVKVPLGQTVAIAGYESLFEETRGAGTPILRHIPILNWFTSGESDTQNDEALLVLVSVRVVDIENEAPMVPNTPMKDISLDVDTSNADRAKKERDELREKRHGCTPLTWFRW